VSDMRSTSNTADPVAPKEKVPNQRQYERDQAHISANFRKGRQVTRQKRSQSPVTTKTTLETMVAPVTLVSPTVSEVNLVSDEADREVQSDSAIIRAVTILIGALVIFVLILFGYRYMRRKMNPDYSRRQDNASKPSRWSQW